MKRIFTLGAILSLLVSFALLAAESAPLTLNGAMERAVDTHPSMASSREVTRAAGYRSQAAASGYYPQLGLSLGYQRASVAERTQRNGFVEDSKNNFSSALSLNVTVYDFGRTGGANQAAEANHKSAEEEEKSARDDLLLAVVQAFYAVLATQDNLKLMDEMKVKALKHLELTEQQMNVGLRLALDVSRARSDLAQSEVAIVDAEAALDKARINLGNLTAADSKTLVVERPGLGIAIPALSTDEAVQRALSQRPDYLSLMQKIKAAEAQITTSQSGYFPVLNASGQATYGGPEPKYFLFNWGLGLTMSWTFFSGYSTPNATDEARANLRSLHAKLDQLELAVRQEIQNAELDIHKAEARFKSTKALVDSTRETLVLTEERFNAGLGTSIEVTDARTQVIQAEIGGIQAEYDMETAKANYLKVLGDISLLLPTQAAD